MKFIFLIFLITFALIHFVAGQNIVYSYDTIKNIKFKILVYDQLNYPIKKFATIDLGPSISQTTLALGISKGNHEFSGGINYTKTFVNYSEPPETIVIQPYGINFSYSYFCNSKWKKLHLILKIEYYLNKIISEDWSMATGKSSKIHYSIRNSGLIGLNYKLTDRIEAFGSIGIVNDLFFLMILGYNPCINFGIRYNFTK